MTEICDVTYDGVKCDHMAIVKVISGCEHEHLHENYWCFCCYLKFIGRTEFRCIDCRASEHIAEIIQLYGDPEDMLIG
jgi:hypothetical protein